MGRSHPDEKVKRFFLVRIGEIPFLALHFQQTPLLRNSTLQSLKKEFSTQEGGVGEMVLRSGERDVYQSMHSYVAQHAAILCGKSNLNYIY
jgi:hypothetical protein